ncbi:diaminobutyrate--2-oxoglutarate transaminase [Kordia sp. YSTF-M3]|uniref:Diaminobutyrate--2-oxoglutarate transaminase n=1 Tax=Kordia aestuariivivens TaxID=2759037 RepID=A0ABR7QEG7_9FLAO|nr:diaminobutyrate--2-oxoglutarate transaminase [Kordia aestuariivivens]MBC8756883.1 diaminobutyrate--2-oxoglutarate transaminase [Kordia aestuariivivens]
MNQENLQLSPVDTYEENLQTIWDTTSRPYKLNDNSYLQKQKNYESNARSYPRKFPIAIQKAKGYFIMDTEGQVFMDCLGGAGSLALGHNHPVIKKAIQKSIANDSALLTLDITSPIKDEFVKTLFGVLPQELRENAKIQFCSPCGTDAVEAAIKLVKIATGRSTIFSFSGSYHGMTNGALAITGNKSIKTQIPNLMSDVVFLPFPYHYRCPFGVGGLEAEKLSLHYIENILKDSHSGVGLPAAFILEAVQGEGGVIPASPFWLKGIREITKKYDIPLIVDEVQAGMGRTGHMFAFEESGIIPDVCVLSKAVGGSLPLSVIVYQKYLDKWQPGSHAGTFRGNQLAMATGTAVIKYITENSLVDNSRQKGNYLRNELLKLQQKYPFIGEIRGRGLMIGVEIVDTNESPNALGSYPPNTKLAAQIQRSCLHNGLIIESGGRENSVLRLLTPLNISEKNADDILYAFENALISIN